jgi:hypothetical protein
MGSLPLEVQNSALYTAGYGRSIESNRGAQESHKSLLTKEDAFWGPSFDHAISVEN